MAISRPKYLCIAAVLLAAGTCLVTRIPAPAQSMGGGSASNDVVNAYTKPSKKVSPNFPTPGVVKTVAVTDGQMIKKGDILMAQDDEMDQMEYKRLKMAADSDARMEFANKDLQYKKAVFGRKQGVTGAFSPAEIEEAALDVDRSQAQIKVTQEDTDENKIKAEQQLVKIKKMTLLSEINGLVQMVKVHEGELTSMDPDKPAIVLVQNDPCYVVISHLKTEQVSKLNTGESMSVKYKDETNWHDAKIVYIEPKANEMSFTQEIWLELPNPENRRTGLPIDVKLPEKLVGRMAAK